MASARLAGGGLLGAFDVRDWTGVTKRDSLCIEHLATIDASLCRYYQTQGNCDAAKIPVACGGFWIGFGCCRDAGEPWNEVILCDR